jgi:hypothetical protein
MYYVSLENNPSSLSDSSLSDLLVFLDVDYNIFILEPSSLEKHPFSFSFSSLFFFVILIWRPPPLENSLLLSLFLHFSFSFHFLLLYLFPDLLPHKNPYLFSLYFIFFIFFTSFINSWILPLKNTLLQIHFLYFLVFSFSFISTSIMIVCTAWPGEFWSPHKGRGYKYSQYSYLPRASQIPMYRLCTFCKAPGGLWSLHRVRGYRNT